MNSPRFTLRALKGWSLAATALILLAGPGSAAAAQKAGSVEKAEGRVQVVRGQAEIQLAEGDDILVGDRVRTGATAALVIRFVDDSTISLSRSSEVEISEYLYEANARQSSLKVLFGRLKAAVSKFAGGSNSYRFRTPTAVAGVRGTELVVDVKPAGEGVPEEGPEERPEMYMTEVVVIEGSVSVQSLLAELGQVLLEGGMGTNVRFGAPPAAPQRISPQRLQQLQQTAGVRPTGTGSPSFAPQSFNAARENPGNLFGGSQPGGSGGTGGSNRSGNGTGGSGEGPDGDIGSGLGNTPPPINQEPGDGLGKTPVIIDIRRH